AGINIRSPTSAVIDAEEINNPREKTCWNEEKSNPTADKKRTPDGHPKSPSRGHFKIPHLRIPRIGCNC
ncbi:MAG: hypothetical protein DRH34_10985, partial [Deltaproteobacteria bacterium]